MKKLLLLFTIVVIGFAASAQPRISEPQDTISIIHVKGVLGTGSYIVREVPAGIINGTNTTFTLANTPLPDKESVFVNGLLQDDVEDYTITGKVITLTRAPRAGNKIVVTYLK